MTIVLKTVEVTLGYQVNIRYESLDTVDEGLAISSGNFTSLFCRLYLNHSLGKTAG